MSSAMAITTSGASPTARGASGTRPRVSIAISTGAARPRRACASRVAFSTSARSAPRAMEGPSSPICPPWCRSRSGASTRWRQSPDRLPPQSLLRLERSPSPPAAAETAPGASRHRQPLRSDARGPRGNRRRPVAECEVDCRLCPTRLRPSDLLDGAEPGAPGLPGAQSRLLSSRRSDDDRAHPAAPRSRRRHLGLLLRPTLRHAGRLAGGRQARARRPRAKAASRRQRGRHARAGWRWRAARRRLCRVRAMGGRGRRRRRRGAPLRPRHGGGARAREPRIRRRRRPRGHGGARGPAARRPLPRRPRRGRGRAAPASLADPSWRRVLHLELVLLLEGNPDRGELALLLLAYARGGASEKLFSAWWSECRITLLDPAPAPSAKISELADSIRTIARPD